MLTSKTVQLTDFIDLIELKKLHDSFASCNNLISFIYTNSKIHVQKNVPDSFCSSLPDLQKSIPIFVENHYLATWYISPADSMSFEDFQNLSDFLALMISQIFTPNRSLPYNITLSISPSSLSLREVEILNLLAQGYTINHIAEHLVISPRTVETHRMHISDKLGLRSIAELARYAERSGLIYE